MADAVVLATGGYGNVFYLATNAKGCNATAIWRAYKRGAAFANPCYTQIHPTCIPVDRRVPVEAHAHERVAPQRRPHLGAEEEGRHAARRDQIPEDERDYYLERKYPSFGNLAPRDIASRAAKEVCDEGRGVGPDRARASTSTSPTPSSGSAAARSARGTATSSRCTSASPARTPTRCRCASTRPSHYTMGGLWVDYNLMSTIPGLFVLRRGELLRPRRQPPRRQRPDAGPGRRLLRPPLHRSATTSPRRSSTRSTTSHPEVAGGGGRGRGAHRRRCSPSRASARSTSFHRELGKIMWENCGMAPQRGRPRARRSQKIPALREEFWKNVSVPGSGRRAQPVAREGRPRGRLPRARRADVPRRARARGVLRRPLPRGVPDRRRRGAARRRATSATWRPGSTRATARSRSATTSRSPSRTCTSQTRSYK